MKHKGRITPAAADIAIQSIQGEQKQPAQADQPVEHQMRQSTIDEFVPDANITEGFRESIALMFAKFSYAHSQINDSVWQLHFMRARQLHMTASVLRRTQIDIAKSHRTILIKHLAGMEVPVTLAMDSSSGHDHHKMVIVNLAFKGKSAFFTIFSLALQSYTQETYFNHIAPIIRSLINQV